MSIRQKVFAIVAENYDVGVDELSDDTVLNKDLSGDSIDNFSLQIKLEKEFETTIPDSKAEELETVGDVVQLIEVYCR
jgi:acyl carrier protein